MVKKLPAMQETQVQSLGQDDPREKPMATHSVLLPGESRGQRSTVGYSPWGCKESDMTEWLTFSLSDLGSRVTRLPVSYLDTTCLAGLSQLHFLLLGR